MVLHNYNQTLWKNLMNSTAPSMPEVMYRCRKQVNDEMVNSICLIKRKFNLADALTKKNLNFALLEILSSNKHEVPSRRVFMLQHSLYLNSTFIGTSKVPMQEDSTPTQQPSSSSSAAALQPTSVVPSRPSPLSPTQVAAILH